MLIHDFDFQSEKDKEWKIPLCKKAKIQKKWSPNLLAQIINNTFKCL